MKIAVLIPVYRTPKRLAAMLAQLTGDPYPDKEIVVVVDGGETTEIRAVLDRFRDRITIQDPQAHLGKVAALNRIGLASDAEVLLFLDNDVELNGDPRFLSILAEHMTQMDIAELPKEAIVTSWISHMVRFEFLGFAIATWLFSRIAKRCPSMNGAAFAVRQSLFVRLKGFRAVVNEDMDFAARAFRKKARFGYDRRLKVRNEVPTDLRDWLRQRKRWAFNNLNWLRDHFLYFITHMMRTPRLIAPLLLLFIPFIIVGAVFFILRKIQLTMLLPLIFMVMQLIHGFAGVFLWITHYHLILKDGLLPSVIALVVSGVFHFGFARFLKFKFNWVGFLVFYFLYSPIWIVVNLVVWLMAVFQKDFQLDWKV